MGASFESWRQGPPSRNLGRETPLIAGHVCGRREQAAAVHGHGPTTPRPTDLFKLHFRYAPRRNTPEPPASVHDHDGRYQEHKEQAADNHAGPCEEGGDGLDEKSLGVIPRRGY